MNNRWKNRWLRFGGVFAVAVAAALGPLSARIAQAQNIAEATLGGIALWLVNLVFDVTAWITALSGRLLDWSVEKFILQMSSQVNGLTSIDTLWRIFRDIGNIVFIFLILYAAISIILNTGKSDAKRTLVSVVVVALFVNFSLFATKAVIDTSNVIALQFYENIVVYETDEQGNLIDEDNNIISNTDNAVANENIDARLSNVIAAQLNLSSVQPSAEALQVETDGNINYQIILARIAGIIFSAIAAFVMGALFVLIVLRFISLVLLMIASPLAFITFALPGTNIGKKWVTQLMNQAFFAPAVMAMLYITIYFGTNFKETLGGAGQNNAASLVDAFIEPGGNYDILIFYFTIVGMLIASLIIAKQMGAAGADKAVSYGRSAANWVGNQVRDGTTATISGSVAWTGRNTIGRAGQRLSESETLKQRAAQNGFRGWAARQALNTSNTAAETSFEARNEGGRDGGFREVVQEREDNLNEIKEDLEELSPEEQAAAEQAKLEKEQLQEITDEEKEVLDDRRDAIDENTRRDKEDIDETTRDQKEAVNKDLEDLDDDISNLKDSFNNARQALDNEINSVDSAINKRETLRTQLAKAQDRGDAKTQKRLIAEFNQLTDGIAGVSDADDLEDRKDTLQDRRSRAKSSYESRQDDIKEQKSILRDRKRAIDENARRNKENIDEAAEEQKEAIAIEKQRIDRNLERAQDALDGIINVGQERGEEFVETMMTQESMLNGIESRVRERFGMDNQRRGTYRETTRSRGNMQFGVGHVADIDDDDRQERMIGDLDDLDNR